MKINRLIFLKALVAFIAFAHCTRITRAQHKTDKRDPQGTAQFDPELIAQSWREYSSAEGHFSVWMPGRAREIDQEVIVGVERLLIHAFYVRTMVEYQAGYCDFPQPIEGTDRETAILANVRDSGIAALSGKLLEDKQISVDGHPGLHYKVEFKGGYVINSKIFVVGNRFYQLASTTYGKNAPPGLARVYEAATVRFLDSVRLRSSSPSRLNSAPTVQIPDSGPQNGEGEVEKLLRALKGREHIYGTRAGSQNNTTSKARALPQPVYPPLARVAQAQGQVRVQVIVDENGEVIAAQPISGHPLLLAASIKAARGARFDPMLVNGNPVKYVGVITFNFVPN